MNFRFCRGQLAVILTLIIPALVGAIALGIDVSVFYCNWIKLQKGVDVAVLAGANFLPSNPDLAASTARRYARYNGIRQSEMSGPTLAANGMSISLNASRTLQYRFAWLLGLSSGVVSVTATAGVRVPDNALALAPIGIQYRTRLAAHRSTTLKLAPQQGAIAGNWKPLAIDYTANADPEGFNYRINLEKGYPRTIILNDLINIEAANLVGQTERGLKARLDSGFTADPNGTCTSHTLDDPRMIEIPIVNFNRIKGNSQVRALGFAEFWITSVGGNGNISGELITQLTTQNQAGSGSPQYGALTPVLLN